MKRLNITKEAFEKSKYFQKKYGKLEYVSESGKIFKTSKGKLLKFVVKESMWTDDYDEEDDYVYLKYRGEGKNVVIPDGIKVIGKSAFDSQGGVESVMIPDSVTDIKEWAFYKCGGLKRVTFGNNVYSIGDYAFQGCGNLSKVDIPNSVVEIGEGAFSRCRRLTNITIPASVDFVGPEAFQYCEGLKRILVKGKTQAEAEDMLKDAVDDISIVKGELG